jgi:hypothetical protein
MLPREQPLGSNSDAPRARLSRRSMLFRGLVCAVGGGLANQVLATRRAAAAAKMEKHQAGYRDTPRGAMRCDRCVQFQAPAACNIVEGAISPAGSCDLFAPRSG